MHCSQSSPAALAVFWYDEEFLDREFPLAICEFNVDFRNYTARYSTNRVRNGPSNSTPYCQPYGNVFSGCAGVCKGCVTRARPRDSPLGESPAPVRDDKQPLGTLPFPPCMNPDNGRGQ